MKKNNDSYHAPKGKVNRVRLFFDVLVGVLERDDVEPAVGTFVISSSRSTLQIMILSVMIS